MGRRKRPPNPVRLGKCSVGKRPGLCRFDAVVRFLKSALRTAIVDAAEMTEMGTLLPHGQVYQNNSFHADIGNPG